MSTKTTPAISEEHPIAPFLRMDRMPHIWCPGCGIGSVLQAFLEAVDAARLAHDRLAVVSGIGCTGRAAGYLNADSFHTTHGRPIPFATGLKLGRPELEVVVFSGDGDLTGIGGNHFIHSCRRNLDITYSYAAIEPDFGPGEGMFRYASLLPCPDPGALLPLKIGGTPLHRARRLGASAGLENLWLKDETGNPSASMKDRASVVALLRAVASGADTVAVASTGNAGSSTACLTAAMGLRAVVFVPETAPAAKLTQSLAYGATVLAVRGSYDDAYDLCLHACEERGCFNRSTGFNPFTREGKKTCSFEIWEQLGEVPDRVIVPTGDGNILSGAWKGWRDLHAVGLIDRLPRIDCRLGRS